MDKDKTTTRRIVELIVLAAIVACVALVLVELAANVRGELGNSRGAAPSGGVSRPATGRG